jgi:hypothetical protein
MSTSAHPEDEDLVLSYYGEGDPAKIAAHLQSCPSCRNRRDDLVAMLSIASDDPVPERDPGYGERVWLRLEPRLRKPTFMRRIAPALALAASLVLAFLLGRYLPAPGSPITAPARERVFLASVEDHLDRSERMLVQLAHDPTSGDRGPEKRQAEDLVFSSRLYRQTAERTGDPGLVQILEELERVLVEVENGPESLSTAQKAALQKRVESLLFKVRIMESRVKQRKEASLPPATS